MANILLTQRCVRSCPYCFAKKYMADAPFEETLSWPDLIYLADFLLASGENRVSLLGGEPTLHPHFTEIILYLLERNFHINVFTSGVMTPERFEDAAKSLSGVHPERLSFVCNVNNPTKSPKDEVKKVEEFLEVFGHLSNPGYNIYRPDFDMDFVFDYINRFGLKKFVRLGLAHPIPGKKNAFVAVESMKKMVDRFIEYAPVFERFRVKPGLDCGFPLCVFTDDQLGKLFKITGGRLTFGCGPAVDIGPDMNIWSCFPLSEYHKRSIYDFDSIQDIRKYYEDLHKSIRVESSGIFEACDECIHREENLCQGGCLAHMLNEFTREAPIRMDQVYPGGKPTEN